MQYLSVREKAAQLVSRIAADLPGLTVHDISHLDALWDTASLVAEGAINVNPAEAFVLGVSILLHDAGMSLAAYPGGISELKTTLAWKDAVARACSELAVDDDGLQDSDSLPAPIEQRIVSEVLRRLHAETAEVLAEQGWQASDGSKIYLIDDPDLRAFYGPTIGRIAHSHWWSVSKVEYELSEDLGALAHRTRNLVDRVKLACLLRVADAVHLDSRRAPRFLRAITNPTGVSAAHWAFQERLSRPHAELDAVVFTSGRPFSRSEAEAWWLAYDTLNSVDRELRDVDVLLHGRGREVLKVRRVKGAGSPEMLARSVQTREWRPVDARLQVSDVPRIVENLGGSKLYGNDPTVALRELIQNAADAVQARRRFQKRAPDWGEITLDLVWRAGDCWLIVEDNGIGMSEHILTGPLLDFGTSFWRSSLAMDEFPGLLASGMQAIGRFGIGFFSVFMLGSLVRVYSRRCDKGQEAGRLLEFRGGTSARPILSPATAEAPIDGGTRVEVLLKIHPADSHGLLSVGPFSRAPLQFPSLVASIAPNLDVNVFVRTDRGTREQVIRPGDWLELGDADLISRLDPQLDKAHLDRRKADRSLMRPIVGATGELFGRAFINPSPYFSSTSGGWVTISGLRAGRLSNLQGVLLGQAVTAARDAAQPLVTKEALARWATEQARLIEELVSDEDRQARSAEVILECGGDVGGLKLIKWGSDWLNAQEFLERLGAMGEIAISFDGEFRYDEDEDDIHPKEFREDFVQDDGVAIALRHDGEILRSSNWPAALTGEQKPQDSRVAGLVRNLIAHAWNGAFAEDEDDVVVGAVNSTRIHRRIPIFRMQESTHDGDVKPGTSPDFDATL
ncbi:signal transduction histidine kinase [Povalibacter uvarum]|uniref:Signal transduction histidine kinase n=1 Tax=Povalibacter uvarum TaxID=732238 RepID=A0A841HWA6_9GAMM|nr:ATP-binding protein [Povalibacter uvarum]MBB6096188.1 signal transduction histidine kinase [Povalibacter uvarum]